MAEALVFWGAMSHVPYATEYTPAPDRRPGAVTTFYVYCGLMVLLYLLAAVGGVLMLANANAIADRDPEITTQDANAYGWILLGMGLILATAFFIPPLLPRRKWAWIIGIIMIALGLTSCCLWPLCIPLMVFYVQSPARQWYNEEAQEQPGPKWPGFSERSGP